MEYRFGRETRDNNRQTFHFYIRIITTMTTSHGASSLFEKYTALNNSIATTRADIQVKQQSVETLESKIAILQSSSRCDENKSSAAKEEIETLTQTLQSKTKILSISKEEERKIKGDLDMLLQSKQMLLRKRDDCRLEFLTTCRDFRLKVKRSRVKLKAFEEEASFLRTYEKIQGENTDDILSSALVQYEKSHENRTLALQRVEQLRKERDELQLRSKERAKALEQQKSQLERIRQAVIHMEKEIVLLNENTKECEEMSGGFAKDAARRRQNQQIEANTAHCTSTPHQRGSTIYTQRHLSSQNASSYPSAVTSYPYNLSTADTAMQKSSGHIKVLNNPYRSKTNGLNVSSSHELVKNPYHDDGNESVTNSGAESFIKQQYPHREGRIRVDRQFSTAVSIGARSAFSLEKNGDETSVTGVIESTSSSSGGDDDDDDLLTFIPFASSNR